MSLARTIKNALGVGLQEPASGDEAPRDRDLAYELNRWERYTWRRTLEELGEESKRIDEWIEKRPAWPLLVRELWGRLYTGDELPESVKPKRWATTVHDAATTLPEFHQLLDLCRDIRFDAGIAAVALGKQLDAALDPEETGENDGDGDGEEGDGDQDGGGGAGGGAGGEGGNDPDQDGNGPQEPGQGDSDGNDGDQPPKEPPAGPDPSKIRQALREACQQASDDINRDRNAMAALGCGWGSEPGEANVQAHSKEMLALAKRLREDKRLAEIAELAGRFTMIARQKKLESCERAGAELVDVTLGRDPSLLMPTELMRLRRRALRLDMLRRLFEGAALIYEVEGEAYKGKGPMVILVDASSSMSGEKDKWAKAVALALRNTAAREKRPAHIVVYNHGIKAEYTENGDLKALLDTIDLMPSGGTDWIAPFNRGREMIDADDREWEDADLIMITDDECGVPNDWKEAWNEWRKKRGVNCLGVILPAGYYGMPSADNSTLSQIADRVLVLDPRKNASAAAERIIEVAI